MGLSLVTFVYIVSGAVFFLVLMAVKLYSETSKYSEEIQAALEKRVIECNKGKASLSVLQTKYEKLQAKEDSISLEAQAKIESFDQLENQLLETSESLSKVQTENEFLKKFESELQQQTKENHSQIEELTTENLKLKEDLSQINQDAEKRIEIEKKQKLEKVKNIKTLQKSEKEILSQLRRLKKQVSEQKGHSNDELKQAQTRIEQQKHEILSLQKTIENKDKLFHSLEKEISEAQNLRDKVSELKTLIRVKNDEIKDLSMESNNKKNQAHVSKDYTELQAEIQLKIDYEKKLRKRVLKAHSIILTLEKKNLELKSKIYNLKNESKLNNVIAFPQKHFNNAQSEFEYVEGALKSGKMVEPNELELLKVKIDQARKSLYEIQSLSKEKVAA